MTEINPNIVDGEGMCSGKDCEYFERFPLSPSQCIRSGGAGERFKDDPCVPWFRDEVQRLYRESSERAMDNLVSLCHALPEFNKAVEECPAFAALVKKVTDDHNAKIEAKIAEEEGAGR